MVAGEGFEPSKAYGLTSRYRNEGLKSPYWPDVVGVVLSGVVLVARVDVLVPRAARIALRRGPVVERHETSNTLQIVIHQFHLTKRAKKPISFASTD